MAKPDTAALRGIRDRLRTELGLLDEQGETFLAMELNSAIEAITERLGEQTDPAEIDQLRRRYFTD